MSDKNSQNPLSGIGKAAQKGKPIPEDANKSLPEGGGSDGVVKASPASVAPTNPPPGVVQDDNKPSNDHGQADPENNEISEFDESKKQAASANSFATTLAEGAVDNDVIASFTSHPVNNFRLGKHQFTDGVLNFTDSKKLAKFEELLEDLPPAERNRIKKLDLDAAKRISQQFQAQQPKATTTTDSSVGERGMKPKVGTGVLGKDGNGGEVK